MDESLAQMHFDAALAALDAHYQAMPPVAAMHLRIAGFDGDCLRLQAPLARHVNDKGCAFGGSLVSLMTLAAWGLVTLRLQQAGMRADVFVADSQVRYLAPLYDELNAEARLAADAGWERFLRRPARARPRQRVDRRLRAPAGRRRRPRECRARYVAIAKG